LLQDVEELVQSVRIEAGGNADVAMVIEDQFEGGRGTVEVLIDGGRQRQGTDMDRQEGR
jgi:hypothetical protein